MYFRDRRWYVCVPKYGVSADVDGSVSSPQTNGRTAVLHQLASSLQPCVLGLVMLHLIHT